MESFTDMPHNPLGKIMLVCTSLMNRRIVEEKNLLPEQ